MTARIHKLLTIFVVLSPLFISGCDNKTATGTEFAATRPSSTPAPTGTVVPEWLFGHRGESATVTKDTDTQALPGEYVMVVKLPLARHTTGLHTVTVFSDRPVREESPMKVSSYTKLWRGKGTFHIDPPNALLLFEDSEGKGKWGEVVVTIVDARFDAAAGTLTYKIRGLDESTHSQKKLASLDGKRLVNISFFVDSIGSWWHHATHTVSHAFSTAASDVAHAAVAVAHTVVTVADSAGHALSSEATSIANKIASGVTTAVHWVESESLALKCEAIKVGMAAIGTAINIAIDSALEAGGDDEAAAGEAESAEGFVANMSKLAQGTGKALAISSVGEAVAGVIPGISESEKSAIALAITEVTNVAMGEAGTTLTDFLEPIVLNALGCGESEGGSDDSSDSANDPPARNLPSNCDKTTLIAGKTCVQWSYIDTSIQPMLGWPYSALVYPSQFCWNASTSQCSVGS